MRREAIHMSARPKNDWGELELSTFDLELLRGPQDFAARLRRYRENRDLTLIELAERLKELDSRPSGQGLSAGKLSRLENAKSVPDLIDLKLLARALN